MTWRAISARTYQRANAENTARECMAAMKRSAKASFLAHALFASTMPCHWKNVEETARCVIFASARRTVARCVLVSEAESRQRESAW